MAAAIEVRSISKQFKLYHEHFTSLKERVIHYGRIPYEPFMALQDIDFDVEAGSTVGILGHNGCGKSTLLKCVAGILQPTRGEIVTRGRVAALLELGAGFNHELTGRENVFMNAAILGLSKKDTELIFDEIVAFSELERFIDMQVRHYSSGMYVRLGFAVAVNVDPDILLVDEVLAVGDEAFTHKCLDKLAELRRRGRTVLLVTHSLDLVTRFCDEALWLDAGVARAQGDPKRVIDAYLMDVAGQENRELAEAGNRVPGSGIREEPEPPHPGTPIPDPGTEPADMFKAAEGRWGSREAEITAVEMIGVSGQPAHLFQSGERVDIRLHVRANQRLSDFAFGVGIFNAEGVCCYGTNTLIDGGVAGELAGEGLVVFEIDGLNLVEGTYKLDVAVHRQDGVPYDYHRLLYTFRVKSPRKEAGIFRPPHRWSFSGGIRMSGL